MKHTKRRYIESHWLVFAMKGLLAIVAGIWMIVSFSADVHFLTRIVGATLLGMSVIEVFNIFHRRRLQRNWSMPLAISAVELIVALALLILVDPSNPNSDNLALRIAIFAGFTVYASVISVIIGMTCYKNITDSMFWIVNGIIGAVLGFAIFADNGVSPITHIRLFGIYLLVKGLTEFYFGIHSKDEMMEIHSVKVAKSKKIGKAKK